MYSIGDYVVKVNDGVCRVEELTHLEMSGVSHDKLYCLLVPVHNKGSHIFVPVESKAEELRFVMTPAEVNQIMEKIPDMETEWIVNNKFREQKYKEVLHEGNPECMVGYIKIMYEKRRERDAMGKKNTAIDERYLRLMEEAVYTEFAFSLDCEKAEIKEKITNMF